MRHLLLALFIFFSAYTLKSQEYKKRKTSVTGLPYVVSSPETSIEFGIYGQIAFDLVPQSEEARQSQISLALSRTLKKQNLVSFNYLLFSKNEKYFAQGKIAYSSTVDRFYGIGNNMDLKVKEIHPKSDTVDLMFSNISYNYFLTNVSLNKQFKKGLFAGIRLDYTSVWKYDYLYENVLISDSSYQNFNGKYLGAGLGFVWDTRKFINSPLEADYLQFSWLSYGMDYTFTKLLLDYRKYFNFLKNQTLAVRAYGSVVLGNKVPFYAINKIGGNDLIRGFFRGTFTDKNNLLFEAEYRIPFFKEGSDAPLWKIWKRLGMTAFISAGQVAPKISKMSFAKFRAAGGLGFRVLLNKDQRSNIRIDYARGFFKNQSGFYVTINEAF